MIKQFFDRRGEKQSRCGAKTYDKAFQPSISKIAESECNLILYHQFSRLKIER